MSWVYEITFDDGSTILLSAYTTGEAVERADFHVDDCKSVIKLERTIQLDA